MVLIEHLPLLLKRRPHVWWPASHLGGFFPGALAAEEDTACGCPACEAVDFAELFHGPVALVLGIVLHARKEEGERGLNEGSSKRGVNLRVVICGDEASQDAGDVDGVGSGFSGLDAGGHHLNRRHAGVAAVEDDHRHVVKHLQGGDGVSFVVDCGAEGGGVRRHVFDAERLVFGAEGLLEDVEGFEDFGPVALGVEGGRVEVVEVDVFVVGVHVAVVAEAAGEARRAGRWRDHAVLGGLAGGREHGGAAHAGRWAAVAGWGTVARRGAVPGGWTPVSSRRTAQLRGRDPLTAVGLCESLLAFQIAELEVAETTHQQEEMVRGAVSSPQSPNSSTRGTLSPVDIIQAVT